MGRRLQATALALLAGVALGASAQTSLGLPRSY